MSLHVAVTGTQHGLTDAQASVAGALVADVRRRWLEEHPDDEETWLHHGQCVGADEEVALAARQAGWLLHAYPARVPGYLVAKVVSDETELPKEPLRRNHHLVDRVAHLMAGEARLLALPRRQAEELHSGTWATVRYAWTRHVEVTIIWPSGATERHREAPHNHWRLGRFQ